MESHPTERFRFPRGEVMVSAASLQRFAYNSLQGGETLDELKRHVNATFGELKTFEPKRVGKKKRDDVRIEFETPIEMGRLQVLQDDIRDSLKSSYNFQGCSDCIDLVPETMTIQSQPIAEPLSTTTSNTTTDLTIVVDTDVISHLLRKSRPSKLTERLKHQDAMVNWLMNEFEGRKVISWQTQAEFFSWITYRSFSETRIRQLEDILQDFEVIDKPDRLTQLIWANLMNRCRSLGRPAGAQDMWVAATALRLGAPLCTFNIKDYDYLPGIQIVDLHADPDEEEVEEEEVDVVVAVVADGDKRVEEEGVEGEGTKKSPNSTANSKQKIGDPEKAIEPLSLDQYSATSKLESYEQPQLHIQGRLRRDNFDDLSYQKYCSTDLFRSLAKTLDIQQSKLHPELFLFNAKQRSRGVSELESQCRGLILDASVNWSVACYPLDAFFNPGEKVGRRIEASFDWKSCQVFRKEDGTLINMYYHGNSWRVATRGRPDCDSIYLEHFDTELTAASHDGDVDEGKYTFKRLFWNTFHNLGYEYPSPDYRKQCFSFELVSPENRVVVPVREPRLILLAARNLETHQELPNDNLQDIALSHKWEVVKSIEKNREEPWTLDAVRELAENLSCVEGEGFVCCDKEFHRLKIKGKSYVAASHLPRPNWGLPSDPTSASKTVVELLQQSDQSKHQASILKLVMNGEQSEFEAYFPEWSKFFRDVSTKVDGLVDKMAASTNQTKDNVSKQQEKSLIQLRKHMKSSMMSGQELKEEEYRRLTWEFLAKQKPPYVFGLFEEWEIEGAGNRTKPEIVLPEANQGSGLAVDNQGSSTRLELTKSNKVNWFQYVELLLSVLSTATWFVLGSMIRISRIISSKPSFTKEEVNRELAILNEREFDSFYKPNDLGRIMVLEEFLRLLSKDERNRETFVLLGSILTRQFIMPQRRSSSDLDFMCFFPWDPKSPVENVVKRIQQILSKGRFSNGFVQFDCSRKIEGYVHWEETNQPGVKCNIKGCTLFGNWTCDIEIDVAFGDPIIPVPFWLDYKPLPTLFKASKPLETIPVLCVRPELLFTFKLHGLFEHNTIDELGRNVQGNWRAKDLLDLWLMMKYIRPELNFDVNILPMAIDVAFAARQQSSAVNVMKILERRFGASGSSQRKWRSFRKKYPVPDEIPLQLHKVVGELADFLSPLLKNEGVGQKGFSSLEHLRSESSEGARTPEAGASHAIPTDRRLRAIKSLSSDASMVVPLPGLYDVFKTNNKVYFRADSSFGGSDDTKRVKTMNEIFGVPNDEIQKGKIQEDVVATVKFLGREEEFEVVRIVGPKTKTRILPNRKEKQEIVPGFLEIRNLPIFTARACAGVAIIRRIPGKADGNMTGADWKSSIIASEKGPNITLRSAREEEFLQQLKLREQSQGQSLARRLQVLQPIQKLAYITSSREKFHEAVKCLAEYQQHIVHVADIKPPFTTRLDPERIVECMARYCFSVLGYGCFCDLTWLEIVEPEGSIRYFVTGTDESSPIRSVDGYDFNTNDSLGGTTKFKLDDNYGKKATLRALVCYCGPSTSERGEEIVQINEGSLEGRIIGQADSKSMIVPLPQPLQQRTQSTQETKVWNNIFIPDGYQEPINKLGSSAFCLGARHLPFLELAQNLRNHDAGSVFEIHVTVKIPQGDNGCDPVKKFVGVCDAISKEIRTWSSIGDDSGHQEDKREPEWAKQTTLRPVLIENATGVNPTQMMTASHHVGTLEQVHIIAFRISQELAKRGYEVSRTKIEALMSNKGIPLTEEEAQLLSPENYFEFHIKLRLPPGFDYDLLKRLAAEHDAHLSRNPMQTMTDGWQKRFVNLRMYSVGKETAVQRLDRCIYSLQSNGFTVDRVIREYAVYDSNVALDKGWIDKKTLPSTGEVDIKPRS